MQFKIICSFCFFFWLNFVCWKKKFIPLSFLSGWKCACRNKSDDFISTTNKSVKYRQNGPRTKHRKKKQNDQRERERNKTEKERQTRRMPSDQKICCFIHGSSAQHCIEPIDKTNPNYVLKYSKCTIFFDMLQQFFLNSVVFAMAFDKA